MSVGVVKQPMEQRGTPPFAPLLVPPPVPPRPSPPPPFPTPYYAVPAAAALHDPPAYVLLPAFPLLPRRRSRRVRACSCFIPLVFAALASLFLSSAVFLLWPSDPDVRVAYLRLHRLYVAPLPRPSIDLDLRLNLSIRNPDLFSLDYRSIVSSVSYRGKPLGSVVSEGGLVRARGVSNVSADILLDGVRVIDEAIYLIEDLARGSILLDTVTEVEGTLKLFSLGIPVKGRISCSLDVNPQTQKIIHQDCYPE